MFDIAPTEFLLLAVVALVVIGPKDLPKAMRLAGQWVGRARAMARHFRTGIDTMIREAEMEEMEKKWASENQRIMSEHPVAEAHEAGAPPQVEALTQPAAPPPALVLPPASASAEAAPSLFEPAEMPAVPAAAPAKRPRRKKAAP